MNLLTLIRYNLLGLLVSLMSLSANSHDIVGEAKPENYMMMTNTGGVKIDIGRYCNDSRPYQENKYKQCDFIYKEINIRVGCSTYFRNHSTDVLCGKNYHGDTTVVSNRKIKKIVTGYEMEIVSLGLLQIKENSKKVHFRFPENSPWYRFKLTTTGGHVYGTSLVSIVIDYADTASLFDYFVKSKQSLLQVYNDVLDQTLEFQSEIARSHQGHLDRYIQTLRDGIGVLNDKKGYSLLDWRVLESSRRIVAFGLVVSEILEDYFHVWRLRRSINTINTLTDQLQKSYGWNRGLAGNVSKASGALLELLELEVSEIAKIKLSVNSSGLEIYSQLIRKIKKLSAKVNTSRSGDMATQREIFSLLDAWNSETWQNELNSLISAPVDFKKLVARKLSIMLMAMEGISDMTKLDFVIPTSES